MAFNSEKYISSKEETFTLLCNMKVLFNELSERWQEEFLDSLNESTVKIILEDQGLSMGMIKKFNEFDKFFCYLPVSEENRAYIVKKDSILEVYENLSICVRNDFWTNRCYLLN